MAHWTDNTKIERRGLNECWPWTGASKLNGYPVKMINGKADFVHRHVYRLFHKEIPEGLIVMHLCNNKLCLNPSHLYAGTYTQNAHHYQATRQGIDVRDYKPGMLKKVKKGRWNAVSDATVKEIKESTGSGLAVAKRLGVSNSFVSLVRRGLRRA